MAGRRDIANRHDLVRSFKMVGGDHKETAGKQDHELRQMIEARFSQKAESTGPKPALAHPIGKLAYDGGED